MLRRVDRGTHISLVPMRSAPHASWIPVDARSRPRRLADGVREFWRRAELAEVVAHGLLLALVLYAVFLVIPFK
jgi:hypothetical protein